MNRARFLALASGALLMAFAIAPANAEPTVRTTQLSNGLQIVLAPDPRAASVALSVSYAAGSITEPAGQSGITNMLGRLVLGGSERPAGGRLGEHIQAEGGGVRSFVQPDAATFLDIVPPSVLDLAIEVEADRMRSPAFDAADVESVRNSLLDQRAAVREGGSVGVGMERLYGLAFRGHPYAWPVSGLEQDLENIDAGALRAYARKYLAPDRATVTIAGRFDPALALASLERRFERLPRGGAAAPEPELAIPDGERRDTITGSGGRLLMIGWRAAGATSPDGAAMTLLAEVLVGGPSARLGRSEVAPGVTAQGELDVRRAASLLYCIAGIRPGADAAGVERALIDRIEAVKIEKISDQELGRAKKRLEAAAVIGSQTPAGLAQRLGSDRVLTGDEQATDHRLAAIREMTPATLREIARKYLTASGRTVVWVLPDGGEGGREP